MRRFFIILLFFILPISVRAQNNFNYRNSYDNNFNHYVPINPNISYQGAQNNNYYNSQEPFNKSLNNNFDSRRYNNYEPQSFNNLNQELRQSDNNYLNNYDSNINTNYSQHNLKNKINKAPQDGLGIGYRVYDNSNRQSYFCGFNQNKKTFKHENNFNGIYFGIGGAHINSNLEIKYSHTVNSTTGTPDFAKSYNSSGSKILPSIIIGQGRLFSSGLYLGQEFALNVGTFSNENKNFKDTDYIKKASFTSSNFSYYSGKFGYNVIKNILPYVKLSISLSNSTFIVYNDDGTKTVVQNNNIPSFGLGGGIDISIHENIRFIVDYTKFSHSPQTIKNIIYNSKTDYQYRKTDLNTNFSIIRFSSIWRF